MQTAQSRTAPPAVSPPAQAAASPQPPPPKSHRARRSADGTAPRASPGAHSHPPASAPARSTTTPPGAIHPPARRETLPPAPAKSPHPPRVGHSKTQTDAAVLCARGWRAARNRAPKFHCPASAVAPQARGTNLHPATAAPDPPPSPPGANQKPPARLGATGNGCSAWPARAAAADAPRAPIRSFPPAGISAAPACCKTAPSPRSPCPAHSPRRAHRGPYRRPLRSPCLPPHRFPASPAGTATRWRCWAPPRRESPAS